MDVTDEMVEAFCDAEAMDPARTRDGLAAVLALVERDYRIEPRPPWDREHAHTYGMYCPVGGCRWPAEGHT